MMPDILIIAPWLQGGGGQKALIGVLRQMPRERLRLALLFDDNRYYDEVLPYVSELVKLNFPRTPLGVIRARRALDPYLQSARSVYSLMRASHLVLGIGSTRPLAQRKFAATFHQLPSHDSRGTLARIENFFVDRAVRRAGLITAPSQRAISEIRDRGVVAPQLVRYEANVSDASSVNALLPRSGSLQQVRLLFAGRLSEQKGLDTIPALLAACDIPIDMRIVGDGDQESLVKRIVMDTQAPHQVRYLGHSDDVAAHLDWADALFMPSRWELNPMIIWEAWARGRMIVASDIQVFADLAASGPLVRFSTTPGFVEQITNLAENEALRKESFARGLAAFEKHAHEGGSLARYLTE